MKVVLDTNVIISGVLFEGNESEILELVDKNKIKMVVSKEILKEYKQVINYDKFQITKGESESIIYKIIRVAEFVVPSKKISVVSDKSDNKFLECAVESDASFIISGDRHLLQLKEFGGAKILNAKDFLKRFL